MNDFQDETNGQSYDPTRILVTGGHGMVGKSLQHELFPATYLRRSDGDLREGGVFARILKETRPAVVIHLAAKVGGIQDNSIKQYEFMTDNLLINTHVVDACVQQKVPKLIALSSTCVYPEQAAKYPMTEDMPHNGPPERTNRTYAYAKRAMQVQISAARTQYGFEDWMTLYSANVYGPWDDFASDQAHVIPSLMRRFILAKKQNDPQIVIWGDGTAARQFTYVSDLAKAIIGLTERPHLPYKELNFAYPDSITIRGIVNYISKLVGYEGKVVYNGELSGQFRRDVSIARFLELFPAFKFTQTNIGLANTLEYFIND